MSDFSRRTKQGDSLFDYPKPKEDEMPTLEAERIYCIGSPGIVAVSVCAPKAMPREQIEEWVNGEHPTGIRSSWKISGDDFASGHANPCPCDQEPETRLHYLLNC